MNHEQDKNIGKKLRGVNLGGWLVLEKWITPSLFAGLTALDETSYCVELGDSADATLKQHWNHYITRNDFAWLAKIGINAVRLPVGHWVFGKDYPYHRSYGENPYPFVVGGIEIVDRVFDWAEEFGLAVVLDLHAAAGCQNGFDNGGIQNVCEWHTDPAYIEHSLGVLERLAERYHQRPSLHGIEALNEPRWDIETSILKRFYRDAYQRIRQYCKPEDVTVVFHDGFRSYREYLDMMSDPALANVVLDIHRYQCFSHDEVNMDIHQHLRHTVVDWREEASNMIRDEQRVYCGEWSLGLDPTFIALWEKDPSGSGMPSMDSFQIDVAYRGYAAAQLLVFEKYLGWFFWNYKTETMPGWSLRDCVERGWFPGNFR